MTFAPRILATGSYLPERVVPNEALTQFPASTLPLIAQKTGISARRYAADDEFTSDLGAKAARVCLERAGVSADEVDTIVLATSSPDRIQPATATRVQHLIGARRAYAFDVNSVCSGAVFALHVADALIRSRGAGRVLVIASELYSRTHLNPRDFSTCACLGDGAAAMLVSAGDRGHTVLGTRLHTDGSGADLIQVPAGGTMLPYARMERAQDAYFTMRGKDVQIGLRTTADADELHNIYQRIFGDSRAAARRTSWTWQYERNPHSPGGPVVYVARRDSHPLGQMGTMPVTLWWGGREVRGAWGIDYFVDPNAEGQGHSIALAKAWMQGVDVALALGLARTSYLICRRLGFRDLGFVPFFQAVLDPSAIARRRYGRLAGAIAAPVAAILPRRTRSRKPIDPTIAVRAASAIGAEYDALWERARAGFDACVRRDAEYVRWRYRETPHKQYEIQEARRQGVLTGFVVSRHEDYRGLRLGWIVDLFAAADDRATRDALLTAVMRRFADARVARVQALCTSEPLAADLKRHGFFKGEARGHLCARPNGIADLASPGFGRWHVVFGDGDWDR